MGSKVARALVCIVALAGCGGIAASPPARSPRATALLVDARHQGLALEDPLVLDDAAVAMARENVGLHGLPRERMQRLLRWLHDGPTAFRHAPGVTVRAHEALRTRRGDCMTHAVLFVSLARALGVDAFFVHARVARQYLEAGDTLVATTHVAVGYREGASGYVVDVWNPVSEWRLAYYRPLDDAEALALYHSNLAVYALLDGRIAEAEATLRYLAAAAPAVEELASNLAVALLRGGRPAAALRVLDDALTRSPGYGPLYTNAYLAAEALGDRARAQRYAARGREATRGDPIFAFARGVRSFEAEDYAGAIAAFEQALSTQGESVVLHLWLVRAYLAGGHREKGLALYDRTRRLAPDDDRVRALPGRHPELQAP